MGLPVTVYRWDDVGAPQLVNRTPSEIIEILKKCLVEGYGTKSPLGWSVSFEDQLNRKIVFRNSATDGSGGVLRFVDYYGDNRTAGILNFSHGKIANSVDEVLPIHTYSSLGAMSTSSNQWAVIGTSRSFYLIINNSSRPMSSSTVIGSGTWWFGDFDPTLPYDQNTMSAKYVSTANNTGVGWNDSLDYMSNNSHFDTLYDANNDTHSIDYSLLFPLSGLTSYSGTSGTNSNGVPITNLFLAPVLIRLKTIGIGTKDAFDNYLKFSDSRPLVRGAIPGLYEFAQGGYSDQTWPQIRTQNGRNYWIIKQGHVGSCYICIDMDMWYE